MCAPFHSKYIYLANPSQKKMFWKMIPLLRFQQSMEDLSKAPLSWKPASLHWLSRTKGSQVSGALLLKSLALSWASVRLGKNISSETHNHGSLMPIALKVKQPCWDTKWGDAEGAICLPCKRKAKRQHCSGAAIPKGLGGHWKQLCQNQWKAECKVNSKAWRCWKQILNVNTTFLFA